jgi:poly(3-hydroxybutyrate) depolymerase
VLRAYARGCGSPGCFNGRDGPTDLSAALHRFEGVDRRYDFYKTTSGPTPLVVSLHGAYGTPPTHELMVQLRPLVRSASWSLLTPAAADRIWYLHRDPAFVLDLMRDLTNRYCFNEARIHVTGFSMGGMLASLLACNTRRFASAAPVAGIMPANAAHRCRTATSLLSVHGLADRVVPLDGNDLPNMRMLMPPWSHDVHRVVVAAGWARDAGCRGRQRFVTPGSGAQWRWHCPTGTSAEFHLHDQAHVWPTGATAAIWAFLRGERREDSAPYRGRKRRR